MKKILQSLSIILLTFCIFVFTHNEITGIFKLQITLILLIAFCIYASMLKQKNQIAAKKGSFIFLFITTILFLVGSTGWFFSPFFFILYLTTILLAFVFGIAESLSFVITLVLLFSFNIGEVDLAYDFVVVLSLLTTIPLSMYLRKEYLSLKQAKNEILVLREEQKQTKNIVDDVLSNKIHNFATVLRESVNDAKTLAYHLEKARTKKDKEEQREAIITTTEKALDEIKAFEESVTGHKLSATPK